MVGGLKLHWVLHCHVVSLDHFDASTYPSGQETLLHIVSFHPGV